MTPTDPLAGLGELWRAERTAAPPLTRHRRWASRSLLTTSAAAVLITLLAVWSGWNAFQRSDWLHGLAAAAYLATIPVLLAEWRGLARFAAEVVSAPGDLAQLSRRRIALQIRLLSGTRAAAFILLGVGLLAALTPMGHWLGLMWIATAALLWGWQAVHGVRLGRQAARCDAVIAELEPQPEQPD